MTARGLEHDAITELFEASPQVPARTTVPATLGLVAAVTSALSALWTDGLGLAVLLAAVALVLSVVGLAKASRPGVAGGASSATALVLALVTATLVGLRYAGVDVTVADGLTLRPVLDALNALLPAP